MPYLSGRSKTKFAAEKAIFQWGHLPKDNSFRDPRWAPEKFRDFHFWLIIYFFLLFLKYNQGIFGRL